MPLFHQVTELRIAVQNWNTRWGFVELFDSFAENSSFIRAFDCTKSRCNFTRFHRNAAVCKALQDLASIPRFWWWLLGTICLNILVWKRLYARSGLIFTSRQSLYNPRHRCCASQDSVSKSELSYGPASFNGAHRLNHEVPVFWLRLNKFTKAFTLLHAHISALYMLSLVFPVFLDCVIEELGEMICFLFSAKFKLSGLFQWNILVYFLNTFQATLHVIGTTNRTEIGVFPNWVAGSDAIKV
jgi:hypothetical protein